MQCEMKKELCAESVVMKAESCLSRQAGAQVGYSGLVQDCLCLSRFGARYGVRRHLGVGYLDVELQN
jgi:hypothetical protein